MPASVIHGKKWINVLNLDRFPRHGSDGAACSIGLAQSASGHMNVEFARVAPLVAETMPFHTNWRRLGQAPSARLNPGYHA
jgi:hypothetical protein